MNIKLREDDKGYFLHAPLEKEDMQEFRRKLLSFLRARGYEFKIGPLTTRNGVLHFEGWIKPKEGLREDLEKIIKEATRG